MGARGKLAKAPRDSHEDGGLPEDVLAPYRETRSARVHWLGQIPSHWEEKRAKYFFREVDERSEAGEEELLSVSHTTGVTPRSQKNVTMFKAENYTGHKVARPDDIVINTMWAWMSALGVSRHTGIVSSSYGVYRPINGRKEYLPKFVDYLLRIPQFRWEYICRSTGIRASRLRLYPIEFLDIALPRPPIDEQQKIVAFLDAKDAQVRRLVRSKRHLIALLREQTQAIISQAIVQGLNAKARTRETGIDWMPYVPAHWELKRLKYLAKFVNGLAFKPTDWKDSGVPIIRIENLNGGDRFNFTDRKDLPDRLLIQKGDLVFAWSGNRGTSFGSFQWNEPFPGYLNQHIFKLEGYNLHRRYFYYLLRAVTKHVEDNAQGIIGLVHITKPALGAIYVPVAPPDEQKAIADKIDHETQELTRAIERITAEIRLIDEYRERLVSDVVTGKLDVRAVEIMPSRDDQPVDVEDDDIEMELDETMEDDDGE
jgi:type I restriction enzyme S subunit